VRAEPSPPARLLDLSRSVSRIGQGPTGIDRVERAYLDAFLADPAPLFGLVRTAAGFLLLDEAGCRLLAEGPGPGGWGDAGLLSRLGTRQGDAAAAESALRRAAVARVPRRGLGWLLRRHLPAGAATFHVGHAALEARLARTLANAAGGGFTVMIHDVIPLEHPEWQRGRAPERMRTLLRAAHAHATRLVYPTQSVREASEARMAPWGRPPPALVVPLGIEVAAPDPQWRPPLPEDRPHFVSVGTLEPRKNHVLLLDAWEHLAREMPVDRLPRLYLCGARGWADPALFRRLDALRPGGIVRELTGLGDAALSALVSRARAMLFPSLAEGTGLPPLEAAALGTLPLCTALPVYRETLGDNAVYLPGTDSYEWAQKIMGLCEPGGASVSAPIEPPTWQDHFNVLLGRM